MESPPKRLQALISAGSCVFGLLLGLPAVGHAAGVSSVTDTYADRTRINTTTSSNYQIVGGSLRQAVGLDTGSGADGACTIASGTVSLSTASCAGRSTPDAVSFVLSTSVAAGATQLTLPSAPTGLAVQ